MNKAYYFYLLLAGRFISGSGSFFNMIALNLFVFLKTGSPVLTGLAMTIRILTATAVSPYLGNLADKIDRKRGMIISDAVLATGMVILAVLPDDRWMIIGIFIIQAFLGIFQNFFMINFQAALPLLAPKGNLVSANSWLQVVNSATFLLGSIGAAAAINTIGYKWAFAADGISYLVSLAILIFLPIITQERREEKKTAVDDGFWNGAKFLIKTAPAIFLIFFVRCLDGIGSGSHNVALPVFSNLANSNSPNRVYGLILAAWGIGGILSALWMNKAAQKREFRMERLFSYSTILMSAFWIAIFQTQNQFFYISAAVLAGIFDTIATVSYSIILQRTEDAVRGRVMGLSTIALMGGFGSGMAMAAFMAGTFPPAWLVLFWHGITIICIVAVIFYNSRTAKLWSPFKLEEA